MAVQDSEGGRGQGYDRSVRAIGRQRKGRALYRLLTFLAVLLVFGAFLVWSYFIASESTRPWALYVVLLGLGISTTLLIRLLRQLNSEGDRVSTLEDREAQAQLFADRQAEAKTNGQIDVHISARQESDSFERMMDRLGPATQENGAPQNPPDEDAEQGLREALAHAGVVAQYLDRLARMLHDKIRLDRTKSLSAASPLKISSGEANLSAPSEEKPSLPDSK